METFKVLYTKIQINGLKDDQNTGEKNHPFTINMIKGRDH